MKGVFNVFNAVVFVEKVEKEQNEPFMQLVSTGYKTSRVKL